MTCHDPPIRSPTSTFTSHQFSTFRVVSWWAESWLSPSGLRCSHMRYKALIPADSIEIAVAFANTAINAGTAVSLVTVVATLDGHFVAVVEQT